MQNINENLFEHMAVNVIPTNLLRIPSGKEIPFDHTVFANRIDFVPIITDQKTLNQFMQNHQFNQKARNNYQNVRRIVDDYFNNIDLRVDEATQYLHLDIANQFQNEITQFINQFEKVTKNVIRRMMMWIARIIS